MKNKNPHAEISFSLLEDEWYFSYDPEDNSDPSTEIWTCNAPDEHLDSTIDLDQGTASSNYNIPNEVIDKFEEIRVSRGGIYTR